MVDISVSDDPQRAIREAQTRTDAMIGAAAIAAVMGGEQTLNTRVRSAQELEAVVQQGLPIATLKYIVAQASDNPTTRRALTDALIPEATRKRRSRVFTPAESERLERLARVIAFAGDAFGDDGDARLFLGQAHPLLEGRTPAEAARTELGARRVEEILGRMTYGVAV